MKDYHVGDYVKITKSPYSDVADGTIGKIIQIKENHFGKNNHLYIIDLPHTHFTYWEITNYGKTASPINSLPGML